MSRGKTFEKRGVLYQTMCLLKTTLLTNLQEFGESYSFDSLSLQGNSEQDIGTEW